MKIGIFDSGYGGLTVLHQAKLLLPKEDYIFYADTDHVPYGTKEKEELKGYIGQAVSFLADQGVKAVILACNTATSVAVEDLRSVYSFPILGMEPAVKPAVAHAQQKRILVTATPLTVKEEKLQKLLSAVDNDHLVDLLSLPGLVEFAEQGEFDTYKVRQYLEEQLSPFELSCYSVLVLGCTHFNYFKDTLRRILPDHIEMVDGSEGTVLHLKHILGSIGMLEDNEGRIQYYRSGKAVEDEDSLHFISQLLSRLDKMLVIK